MALVYRDLRPGDRIKAIRSCGCCWQPGDEFEIRVGPNGLFVAAKCGYRYENTELLDFMGHFTDMGGPW